MACAKWETIETILPYLDTYLMDIKHTNPAKHKEFTGRSNELMMENARKVALSGKTRLVIRVPVIPTFNDTVEEIQGLQGLQTHFPEWTRFIFFRITDLDRINMRDLADHI